jgi:hypothetical protein
VLQAEAKRATEAGFEKEHFVSDTLRWAREFCSRPKMTKKDLKNYAAKEDRYVADIGTRSKKRRVSGVADCFECAIK